MADVALCWGQHWHISCLSGLGFRRDLQDRGPDGLIQRLNKAVKQRHSLNTTQLRMCYLANKKSGTALSIQLQRPRSDGRLMKELWSVVKRWFSSLAVITSHSPFSRAYRHAAFHCWLQNDKFRDQLIAGVSVDCKRLVFFSREFSPL